MGTSKINSPFLIYVDRLINEEEDRISVVSKAEIFESKHSLPFVGNILVTGLAYFAQDHLVLELQIEATARIPCTICNEMIVYPIVVNDFLHTEEKQNLQAIYDYREEVLSTLLLHVPSFFECPPKCPERSTIEPYLAKTKPSISPFAEID